MRTIRTRATVSEERMLTVAMPPDITPGEHRVVVIIDDVSNADLAAIAQHGGSFGWLEDEPELYSDADGEPV
jgi:hypothetical protein